MAFGGIIIVLLSMGLLGVLVTGIVLMGVGGKTNDRLANKLMVARVWLQALILGTVALMFMAGGQITMVKLNKIYTRTGDKGDTGLVGGVRRPKYDLRVDAYGTVDETNSAIGLARLHTKGEHDAMLKRIQHDLFDTGADLATPYGKGPDKALRITDVQVKRLEKDIDALNTHLSPLNSFVLPGGTPASAYLHLARTIARRAERIICALATAEKINPVSIKYMNRLSDFLFVLARSVNDNGARDVLWEPGVNR